MSYPKICPHISQDIPYIHTQRFLQSWSDKLSPRQSTQTRVWHFSDQDGLLTSPMIFIPPHMFQRFSMSSFKPYKSSFLRQLLRWLKISCIGQKVSCGQHTVKTSDFWSTSSFWSYIHHLIKGWSWFIRKTQDLLKSQPFQIRVF